jgi:NTE family protein
MTEKKIGLALSGGGARGFAHVGVLKVLVDSGVRFDMVAGTSAGSIIGGALAAGMSVDELLLMARNVGWTDLGRPSLSPLGFFSNEPMGRYLASYLPATRFEDLKFPFAAIACDLDTGGEVVCKDSGDMIESIRASCAVPGVFVPITADDGRTLVDGGAVKPLPCDTLREMGADIVIAVDVLACGSNFRSKPRTGLGVAFQSALTLIRAAARLQHFHADIVISPEISHLRPDEIGKRDEFIELGERAARERLDEILSILNNS